MKGWLIGAMLLAAPAAFGGTYRASQHGGYRLEVPMPQGNMRARLLVLGTTHQAQEGSAAPEEDPQVLMARLKKRRRIMNVHETLALVNWGVMTANIVFGSMNYAWRMRLVHPNQNNVHWYRDTIPVLHRITSYGGAGLYLTTGILAWTAPPAAETSALPEAAALATQHKDSGKIHRKLSYVHAAGMGIMILNGLLNAYVTGPKVGGDAYKVTLTSHMIIGYATYALVTASGIIILFS